MIDVQTVSIIIAAASIVAGVVYYALDLRHRTQLRQTDLVMKLYSTFGTKEFQQSAMSIDSSNIKSYNDLGRNFTKIEDQLAAFSDFQSTCTFFEGVGVLLHRKLIEIDLVDDLLSSAIVIYWERFEPIIKDEREFFKQPQIWEWFEYLYNQMKKRDTMIKSA